SWIPPPLLAPLLPYTTLFRSLVEWAPAPMPRQTDTRTVEASEDKFTGFVFKIQANMDPKHRDRVAFMRVVSGKYEKGMKLRQVRSEEHTSELQSRFELVCRLL